MYQLMLLVGQNFTVLLNPIAYDSINVIVILTWVNLSIQSLFYRTAVDFASALDAIWPFFAGKSVLKEMVLKNDKGIKCFVLLSFTSYSNATNTKHKKWKAKLKQLVIVF